MAGGKLGLFPKSAHPSDFAIEQSLAERTSRGIALHNAIIQIVFHRPDEATDNLRAKLAEAVSRLGAWTDASVDWTSEQFMASHAQRLATKSNYELITVTDANGETREGWSFRWPEEQARGPKEQTSSLADENAAFTRSLAVRMSMDDAQKPVTATVADAEAEYCLPRQMPCLGKMSMIAARMTLGSLALRPRRSSRASRPNGEALASHQATWSAIFERALQQSNRDLRNLRYDVMYDAHALAIAGRLYLAARLQCAEARNALLSAVNSDPAGAAAAFDHHPQAAKDIGDGPLRSAIRIGLQACEFPRRKDYDEDQATFDARQSHLSATQSTRLAAERHWIEHGGDEPAWPSPPLRRQRRPKRSLSLPGGTPKPPRVRPDPKWPDTYFDDRTAAVWLRKLEQSTDPWRNSSDAQRQSRLVDRRQRARG